MPKYKALVEKMEAEKALLRFEDGTVLAFPLSKLPEGTREGVFLRITIGIDRITALLHHVNERYLMPKQAES